MLLGQKHSKKTIEKMKKPHPKMKGFIPWNKGLTYKSGPCMENKKAKIAKSNSVLGQRRLMKNGYSCQNMIYLNKLL